MDLLADDVSAETVRDILASDYENIEIDEDGFIIIHKDEMHFIIGLDDERKYIRFASCWQKGDSISENRATRVMNTWNKKKVFTTAYFNDDSFWLEFYMTYKGGLNSANLLETLEWFIVGANQFGPMLDDEDAI